MSKSNEVVRPRRKTEYRLEFATSQARRGWTDLVATARNASVDAWERLTNAPTSQNESCYPLQGSLGTVTVDGTPRQRWQLKPTKSGRIWYAVIQPGGGKSPGKVLLERVTTGHPNETIKQHR